MVELNQKYGCLTVLDMGEEYSRSEEYAAYQKEYKTYKSKYEAIKKELKEFPKDVINREFSLWYGKNFLKCKRMLQPHYKCQCKCGKIHFYNAETIESKPQYCSYPVAVSRKEHQSLENVHLCGKQKCVPSDEFCSCYNKQREKQLAQQEEKRRLALEKIPRIKANNYDTDFTGTRYESLDIIECTDESLELADGIKLTNQDPKKIRKITVHKQYRCQCYLCGKEQLITCDKFGIFPPTAYGSTAYHGYWSKVKCDCHPISSFQWIVNKILIENHVLYGVEKSFENLYGVGKQRLLRFDFVIYDQSGTIRHLIECQGEQHYKPICENYETGMQYSTGQAKCTLETQQRNDELKREYARKHDIPLLEISYKDKHIDRIKEILIQNGIIANS